MIGTYHILSVLKVLLVLVPLKPFENSGKSSMDLVSLYNLSMTDKTKNYKAFPRVIATNVSNDRILMVAASNLTAEILALRLNVKMLSARN